MTLKALLLALFALVASPAFAVTLTATPGTFSAVLATAKGGDVLRLGPGTYPGLRLTGDNTPPGLTIDASADDDRNNPLVTVGRSEVADVQGLTIKGGRWLAECAGSPCYNYALRVFRGAGVTVDGAGFIGPASAIPGQVTVAADGYGLGFVDTAKVRVVNSYFAGFKSSLMLTGVADYEVVNNRFTGMRADGVLAINTWRGRIEGNYCDGTRITGTEHPDCAQLGNRPDRPPTSHVVIRGNIMLGDSQGIFFDADVRPTPRGYRLWTGEVLTEARQVPDGDYRNVTVEDNLMIGSFPKGIGAFDTLGAIVRNNEVRTLPGSAYLANFQAEGVDQLRCGNRALPALGKRGVMDAPCGP